MNIGGHYSGDFGDAFRLMSSLHFWISIDCSQRIQQWLTLRLDSNLFPYSGGRTDPA